MPPRWFRRLQALFEALTWDKTKTVATMFAATASFITGTYQLARLLHEVGWF